MKRTVFLLISFFVNSSLLVQAEEAHPTSSSENILNESIRPSLMMFNGGAPKAVGKEIQDVEKLLEGGGNSPQEENENLSSLSTETVPSFVAPALELSGIPYIFSPLDSEAPCSSSIVGTVKAGSNINDSVENAGESSFQCDVAPKMQMDSDAEIATLRELFTGLGVNDINKIAAEKEIAEVTTAITTGINEKNKAISVARTEIGEHNAGVKKTNKTTTIVKVEPEVQRINKINVNNLWENKAIEFRVKRNEEHNSAKAVYLAKLAQIYGIAAEEISQKGVGPGISAFWCHSRNL